jgi:DNA-binding beta-propeller fold protein YncE
MLYLSGKVVAGGNGQGNRTDQLSNPTDLILDKENDSLIDCDFGNRRVMRWSHRNGTNGEIIISNIDCYGLTMDNDGYLYVSDGSKHEVRRWKIGDISGTVLAAENGTGDRLDQFNGPTSIFFDQAHSQYVSDLLNHHVMKWAKGAKEGIVFVGGHGKGNGLTQFYYPRGIAVDHLGTVYVTDCINDRVLRWAKKATQGSVVADGNGEGTRANQFNSPFGLSFDSKGNLSISEKNNHRVQKFNIDPSSNT